MKNFKTKSILVLILSFLCAAVLACGISLFKFNFASAYIRRTTDIASALLVSDDDLYNDTTNSLDSAVLDTLATKLLGSGKTASDLIRSAKSGTELNAADFRTNNGGVEVTVKFGGIIWIPAYLSESISGTPILTLYQAGVDLTGISASTDYSTTQLISPMTDGWVVSSGTSNGWTTPQMMYGSSYMRAVTLNNGGYYSAAPTTALGSADIGKKRTVTSSTVQIVDATSFAASATDNIYYDFTRGKYADMIVTPRDVQWQADMQLGVLNATKTYNNESYTAFGTANAISATYCFEGKTYNGVDLYGQWADDKVWIPSVTELGTAVNTVGNGIWSLSQEQKKTDDGTYATSTTTGSGTSAKGQYVYTWTRTAVEAKSEIGFYMYGDARSGTNGSAQGSGQPANAFCVRPAIHLALTNIAVTPDASGDSEKTYDSSSDQIFDFDFDSDLSKIKGVTATTFATSTAASTAIASSTYSINSDNQLVAKLAGTYKVEFELIQPTDPDQAIQWGDSDGGKVTRTVTVTIKRKELPVPTIGDSTVTYTYKGTAYQFETSSAFNTTIIDFERPTGITLDTSTNTYSDGLVYDSVDKVFSATNAGTYNVIFKLKDEANYIWSIKDSTTLNKQTVPITIDKKELSISASASDTSLTWKKKDTGSITLMPAVCKDQSGAEDSVSLYLYYQKDGGNELRSGITNNVLDISKITSTGTFTLCAKIITDKSDTSYSADNENYTITANSGVWEMDSTFEITASGIGADDLTWQYKKTGDSLPVDLVDGNGEQIKLEYGANLLYYVSATGNSDMQVYTSYSGDGYVDGYKTVDSNGNVVNGGGCGAVGTYTTYVAIEITNTADYAFDSDHILDGNSKYGWLSFDWTISPRELDFADAEWEYSTDGGDNWIPFKQADGTLSDPEYTGLPILIQLSPDYIASLGLDPDTDITITYGGTTSKKDKGSYTATAELVITNSSYCTPETSDGSDYSISFPWSITNKKIQIKNWNGSHTIVLDDGRAFSVPTVQTSDGLDYSGYLVYTYECVIDGVTQKATDFDGLKALLEQAGVNDSNSLVITATVAVKATQQDSFTLAGTATKEFELGDSKDVISVWLDNETSQYGDVKFGLHAENDGVDYLQYIQVTLSSVLLSEPVTVAGSNVSALMEYLVKTGTYSIALELDARYATGYLLNPTTLSFEITPKEVYVPTVSREIVFTGSNIDLSRYLDGFDPAIMTLDALPKRDAGTVYTATITLIDQFNYVFVMKPEPDADATKSTVKLVLTGYENSINFANDEHTSVDLKWQINPFVLDSSYLNTSGKEGVQFIMPTDFGELDLEAGYRYFDDAASTTPMDPVFKGGNSFYVDVFLTGEDAKNFVFENGTTVSDKVVYTVPQSGAAAFFGSALSFVKSNWLWFVIGAAVLLFLILLIIIIAVAKKKKKKKEEEKEKSTNAAAGAMPMAAMAGLAMADDGRAARAEAEAAKAKAQIEIERAKMEAEMAKMRAQMEAKQQIELQQAQQPAPQPVQQPAQQIQQVQPYPQQMPPMQMPMMQQFPQQMPAQSADGGMMMAMMQAQLAEMRAQQNAALKTELEIVKAKLESRHENYSNDKPSVSAELLGNAIISAISKIVAAKSSQSGWDQQVIKSDPPMALNAPTVYPPDAVITTTTTTVDTTNRQNEVQPDDYESNNRSRDLPFDIDGFYDAIDEKFKK